MSDRNVDQPGQDVSRITVAEAFRALWDGLRNTMGSAPTAALLRRAIAISRDCCPHLAEISIERAGRDYLYRIPDDIPRNEETCAQLVRFVANTMSLLAELMGKESGYCHGRGGSMHVANLAQNNLGANGIVGGGIPLATGAGLAVKYKGGDQVVICFFGDGAINQGVFHESINLAAIYKLPVIFVVENNHYAVSTRIQDSTLIPNLSQRADGFGLPGISLDGNDAVVIHEEMVKVVARTRQVQGPTLVECKTYRHGGHHINDPGAYMPEEEMKYWKSKDPVLVLRKRLADEGVAEHELKEIEQRVEAKIEEAVAFAINSPEPSKEAFLAEISVF